MITFLFNFKEIGGVQVLIFNLMRELSKSNIRTKLIYHKNSWLTDELKKHKVEFDFFCIEDLRHENINIFVKHDDILVTTILFMELVSFTRINPYFLLWDVSFNTFFYEMRNYVYIRKLTRKRLINKMLNKKGLVFMDKECVRDVEKQLRIKIDPSYLPIPVITYDVNHFLQRQRSYATTIHLTYIGRAITWKIAPVRKLLSDLEKISSNSRNFCLHIITDDVDRFRNGLDFTPGGFEVEFHQNLSGERLREFLVNTSDLHIAMGTSCLEGATLGIPSILLDASYRELPENYTYKWIFENDGYSLGRILDGTNNVTLYHNLSEILVNYGEHQSESLSTISHKCYEYVKHHHDVAKITNDFVSSCSNSRLKINDVLYTDLGYYVKEVIKRRFNKDLFLID